MARTSSPLPDHVRRVTAASDLDAILSPTVNLVIWQRGGCAIVAPDRMLDEIDDVAVELNADELSAGLPPALAAAGYAPVAIGILSDEMIDLGSRFAALSGAQRLSFRLEVVETDACRRFHADYVTIRLIATLTGSGTQWLDNDDAAALAAGADVATLAVRRIATGDVALFKGREATATPIIHRSPPIGGTGERRLVLVVDPAREAHG